MRTIRAGRRGSKRKRGGGVRGWGRGCPKGVGGGVVEEANARGKWCQKFDTLPNTLLGKTNTRTAIAHWGE